MRETKSPTIDALPTISFQKVLANRCGFGPCRWASLDILALTLALALAFTFSLRLTLAHMVTFALTLSAVNITWGATRPANQSV